MPRHARAHSESGYYHIMLRGIDRQDIFFDDEDRLRFLDTIHRFKNELGTIFGAYCLMTNHVHMLLKQDPEPDLFVKKLASSYVFYFNRKYERIGHLFQERYASEPVDTNEYYLTVTRYILQNPMKAGICRPDKYPWNSWNELHNSNNSNICDMSLAVELAGGITSFERYVLEENEDTCLDLQASRRIDDAQAKLLLQQIASVENPLDIAAFPAKRRNEILARLKTAGLSVRQLSRLTGINRNIIQRAR